MINQSFCEFYQTYYFIDSPSVNTLLLAMAMVDLEPICGTLGMSTGNTGALSFIMTVNISSRHSSISSTSITLSCSTSSLEYFTVCIIAINNSSSNISMSSDR